MNTSAALSKFVQLVYMNASSFPTSEAFYQDLIRVLSQEDVCPQFYQVLMETRRFHLLPGDFRRFMKEQRDRVLVQHYAMKRETDIVTRAFETAQLQVIVLKGIRFAERYFGATAARSTSDIDLMIGLKDYRAASTLLETLGFQVEPNPAHQKFIKHRQFTKPIGNGRLLLSVELHQTIIRPYAANLDVDLLWQHSVEVEGYHFVRELSDEHTLYATCIHAGSHALDHLKHRIDVLHLLCRDKATLSFTDLIEHAKHDETLQLITMVLTTIYEEFPFLHSLRPLPPGLRSKTTRSKIPLYILYELAVLNGWKRRLKFLFRWVFLRQTMPGRILKGAR